MKKRIIVLALGVIVLFISVSLILYYLPYWEALSQKGLHDININDIGKDSTPEPIKQGENISLYKDELFFINDYAGGRLYKLILSNKKTSEMTSKSIESFCIYDGWIYYIEKSYTEKNGLYRMKPDGSDKTKLADDAVRNLVITDDWVYFLSEKEIKKEGNNGNVKVMDNAHGTYIYRARKDGSELGEVGNTCSMKFVVDGDKIYYIESNPMSLKDFFPKNSKMPNNFSIYMMNTDGTEKHDLAITTSWAFDAKDTWIYYSNDGIYKSHFTDLNGETYKVLSKSADRIRISGDIMFFTQEKTTKGLWGFNLSSLLYKVNLDGKNLTKISKDDAIDSIDISGGYVLYHTIELQPALINKIAVITNDGTKKQLLMVSVE